MIYWELFTTFLLIGSLSFGGGYAVLPLIEEELVMNHGWLSNSEFVDLLTISEMSPGPIGVNSATFAGNRVAGVPGGLIAVLGVITPSIIITLTLAYFYFKYKDLKVIQGVIEGLRPAVVALIANAGLTIILSSFFDTTSIAGVSLSSISWINVAVFTLAFYLMRKYKLSPISIIIMAGVIGGTLITII